MFRLIFTLCLLCMTFSTVTPVQAAPPLHLRHVATSQVLTVRATGPTIKGLDLSVDGHWVRGRDDRRHSNDWVLHYRIGHLPPGTHRAQAVAWGAHQTAERHWIFHSFGPLVLTVDQQSAAPGSTVIVEGKGFRPRVLVRVTAPAGAAGQARSDRRGRVTVPVALGPQVPSGPLVLTARAGHMSIATSIEIVAARKLEASRTILHAGDALRLTAQGFTPGTVVKLGTIGQSRPYAFGTVGATGSASFALHLATLPDGSPLQPGALTLMVMSDDSDETARVVITVLPPPSLALPAAVPPGSSVLVSGRGFTPGQLSLFLNGQEITSAMADTAGAFSATVPIPPDERGRIIITVRNTAGDQASAQTTVETPEITAQSSPAGTTVVAISGFPADTALTVSADGVSAATVTTNNAGVATISLRTPSGGFEHITVTGGGLSATVTSNSATSPPPATSAGGSSAGTRTRPVLATNSAPAIALSSGSTSITTGIPFTIIGNGFPAGSLVVIGLRATNGTVSGDYGHGYAAADGSVSIQTLVYTAPNGAALHPGQVTLVAHTDVPSTSAALTVQVIVGAILTASPSPAHPTDTLTLQGALFLPGEELLIHLTQGQTVSTFGPVYADASGSFTAHIFLGQVGVQPGALQIAAFSSTGTVRALTTIQVVRGPEIIVNRGYFQAGDQLNINGQGFVPGVPVIISVARPGGIPAGNYGTATPDVLGEFAIKVTIAQLPDGNALPPGPFQIVAHSADNNESASAPTTVLTLSASVLPSGTLLLQGDGWIPFTRVNATASQPAAKGWKYVASGTISAVGHLDIQIPLNHLPRGTLEIAVSDDVYSETASVTTTIP